MQKSDNCIWKSRLSLSTKLKLYNVCILPIMLYGSECWALSRVDDRKVDALDQWCLRRILDIRWYHRVPNCEVRRLTEQPPSYYNHTEKKTHAVWSSGQNGRVSRCQENSDCSSREWVEASWATLHLLDGLATLKNDLAWLNLTLEDAIELALNKPLWRLLAASRARHWWCMTNNDDDDVLLNIRKLLMHILAHLI